MQNTWKLNSIGKNIIIIKSQWRKEMQLPGTSEKEHCCPYAWEVWAPSSLDIIRGAGDCAVTARAGAGSLQSVNYRGNIHSTSSSQLIHSDQGFTKSLFYLWHLSLVNELLTGITRPLLEGNSYSLHAQYTVAHTPNTHTETVLCTLPTALLETILKQQCCFFSVRSWKWPNLIALSPFTKCKTLAS